MTKPERLVVPVTSVAVLAVAIMLLRRFDPKRRTETIRWVFERLPDGFPPKWIHSNIKAIREQGERILRLLEERHEDDTSDTPNDGVTSEVGSVRLPATAKV